MEETGPIGSLFNRSADILWPFLTLNKHSEMFPIAASTELMVRWIQRSTTDWPELN